MSTTIPLDIPQERPSDFYFACAKPDLPRVKWHLNRISIENINRIEPNGSTALHVACYRNNASVVYLLMRHGASGSQRNKYGLTPFEETTSNYIKDLLTKTGSTDWIEWTFLDPLTREMKRNFDAILENTYSQFGLGFLLDYLVSYYIHDHAKRSPLYPLKPRTEQYFEQARRSPPTLVPVITAYTAPDSFDRILNQHCIDRISDLLRYPLRPQNTLTASILYIVAALNCAPILRPRFTFTGRVYRGAQMSFDYFQTFKKDEIIVNRAFVSTSKLASVADAFAGDSTAETLRKTPRKDRILQVIVKCIYDIRRPQTRAIHIANMSYFDTEEEVLLMPVSAFRVVSVDYDHRQSVGNVLLEDCDLPSEEDPCPVAVRCDFAEMPRRNVGVVVIQSMHSKKEGDNAVTNELVKSSRWKDRLISFIQNMSRTMTIVLIAVGMTFLIGIFLAILLPNVLRRSNSGSCLETTFQSPGPVRQMNVTS